MIELPDRPVYIVFSIARSLGFGEVLRGHRRAARLTLEQLAEVSGVSARTLSLPWKGMPASSLSSWRVMAGCGITGRAQPACANCPGWLTTSPAGPRNWSG